MGKSELEVFLARIDVWLLIFGVIVVLGVAGESVFGIIHWWNSRKLQEVQRAESLHQEERIALLTKEAADANRRALELQALVQPRDLTTEQQEAIGRACTAFSGHKVTLQSNTVDLEGWLLAQLIRDSLERAGIQVGYDPGNAPTFATMGSGILVTGPANEQEFITTIRTSLASIGKLRVADQLPAEGGTVLIAVGVRPFRESIPVSATQPATPTAK